MANTHSNLTSLFTDIADAIREKTGTTGQIVADKFPENIRGIDSDGSSIGDDIVRSVIEGTIKDISHSSITSIPSYTFAYCTSLTSVSFPSCESIGSYAFAYCTSLTSVSFPSCESIREYAFYSCKSLTSVSFPLCKNISQAAFAYCSKLASINFPMCTSIGPMAFMGSPLTSIDFPSCKYIGGSAFMSCKSLVSISFPLCANIGADAFRRCNLLTSINFPSCRYIDYNAFGACYSLISINFPICSSIKGNAFAYCSSITSINFPSCRYIGESAFISCYALSSISFPVCISVQYNAFGNCTSLTSISFPSCEYVDGHAFSGCTSLTTAYFSICKTIGYSAFYNCCRLSSLYINTSSICGLEYNALYSTPYAGYSSYFSGHPRIYVPASLVSAYQSGWVWSKYSSYICAIEDTYIKIFAYYPDDDYTVEYSFTGDTAWNWLVRDGATPASRTYFGYNSVIAEINQKYYQLYYDDYTPVAAFDILENGLTCIFKQIELQTVEIDIYDSATNTSTIIQGMPFMTWEEWIMSEYSEGYTVNIASDNSIRFVINGKTYVIEDNGGDYGFATKNDYIHWSTYYTRSIINFKIHDLMLDTTYNCSSILSTVDEWIKNNVLSEYHAFWDDDGTHIVRGFTSGVLENPNASPGTIDYNWEMYHDIDLYVPVLYGDKLEQNHTYYLAEYSIDWV